MQSKIPAQFGIFPPFALGKLIYEEGENLRKFTWEAKQEANEEYTIYGWFSISGFVVITVDWTQDGMRYFTRYVNCQLSLIGMDKLHDSFVLRRLS